MPNTTNTGGSPRAAAQRGLTNLLEQDDLADGTGNDRAVVLAADVLDEAADSGSLFPATVTTKAGPGASTGLNGWHVQTNVWNQGTLVYGTDFTTSVSYNPGNLDDHPLWKWSFPAETTTNYYTVHAYEEIMYGGSPWWDAATSAEPTNTFPLAIADLASLDINYSVAIGGDTNGFNIAFEIWLESTPGSGSANLTNEIMVWFHHGSMTAGGSYVGTYSSGDFSGSIYNSSNWNSWDYTAVMSDSDLLSSSFDLVDFLDTLKDMGIITGNEYIYGLEFGAEVETGTGWWSVSKLEYDITYKSGDTTVIGGNYVFYPAADFNGDNASDILWQNDSGQAAIWTMNGLVQLGGSPVGGNPGSDWHAVAAGDFDGDGDADILWQNDNGQADIWLMNGFTVTSGSYVGGNPGLAWHIMGTGDFNGDGKADILWQNDAGQAAVWTMNGLTQLDGAEVGINPGADWHVICAADFDGDGKSDILWQNDNGQAVIWLMDGFTVKEGSYVGGNPGTDWHAIAAADFNGDGKADILWQNDNGQAAIWTMDGLTQLGGSPVGGNPGSDWHIIGAGDYNGDGYADILWQNDNGQAAIWTMNGLTQLSGSTVGGNPGTSWHVVT